MIDIRPKVNDLITENEIAQWFPDKPVLIPAQTGQGKTYWVSHGLYDYLKAHDLTCLFLIQRTRTKEQVKKAFAGKETTIHVASYQSVEQSILHKKPMPHYDFIVCDEAQYFTNDVGFNKGTDISFDWIFNQRNSIKIFMSATLESFKFRLMNKQQGNIFLLENGKLTPLDIFFCTPSKLTFSTPYDYSYIKNLTFFHGEDQLERIAAQVIENNHKAVFFIQSTEKALELYKKFKGNIIFSCSKANQKYKKYMDEKLIDSIANMRTFDSAILVTTAALDSGFTFEDSSIDTIVVDMLEPETVIQCVGRKRPISDNDKIDLYIRGRTNEEVNRSLQQMVQDIKSVKLFFENEEEYHILNHRQNSANNVIYNKPIGYDENGEMQYVKAPNYSVIARLEYYAYNLFPQITKAKVKFGYNKYLAHWFGFYDDESKQYTYQILSTEQERLSEYLDSLIGAPLLTKEAKKPFIENLNIRRNGKLCKSFSGIAGWIEGSGLPYRLHEYQTSRVIEGQKKNFRAWEIVKLTVA